MFGSDTAVDTSKERPARRTAARGLPMTTNIACQLHSRPMAIVQGVGAARRTFGQDATGIALRCLNRRSGSLYQVVLMRGLIEAGVLFEARDDNEIIAIWRRMATDCGLPALYMGSDGITSALSAMLGRLDIRSASPRRRNGVLTRRRPRFLMRRRPGRLPARPEIHREDEIVAGEGS